MFLPSLMHQLLEQQIRQWLDSRSESLPPELLAAIDETYRQSDAAQSELRAEIQKARELEAVGRVAGGIAHDFNNLLTVIKGYCDLCIRLSEPDEGPVAKSLEQIAQATERAAEMTLQLLALSRQRKVDPTKIALDATLEQFLPMLRRLVDQDITLNLDAGAPEAAIFADKGRLQQLLLNLVIHAREDLSRGDTLILKTRNTPMAETDLVLRIEVQTGSAEPMLKSSLRRTTGLSVLIKLTQDLGGELSVNATSENPGLTVRLTTYSADSPKPAPPTIVEGTRTRILVVEDEEPVRHMLDALLTDQGYLVSLAASPDEAFDYFETNHDQIDLLLTDIVMPGMHGPEMAEKMKKTCPDLAVLFISGYDPAARERRGAPAPGGAFLQKPFDATTLNLKIREVLGAS